MLCLLCNYHSGCSPDLPGVRRGRISNYRHRYRRYCRRSFRLYLGLRGVVLIRKSTEVPLQGFPHNVRVPKSIYAITSSFTLPSVNAGVGCARHFLGSSKTVRGGRVRRPVCVVFGLFGTTRYSCSPIAVLTRLRKENSAWEGCKSLPVCCSC